MSKKGIVVKLQKDWTGDEKSVFTTLGASNHTEEEREVHDYYATEPRAAELLLEQEYFGPVVWECACGEGHLSKVFQNHGITTVSTDLVDRKFGGVFDFLQNDDILPDGLVKGNFDIITNPPYRFAEQFVRRALDYVENGRKVAMFLKLQFLEGKSRRKLHDEAPPVRVYVSSSRLQCAKNGKFGEGSAIAYAWFVWEKGFKGDPIIKWIN